MKRTMLLTMLALLVGVGLVHQAAAAPGGGFGGPRAANTAVGDYCADPEEQAYLELINAYRAQNGLPALVISQTMSAAADHHSLDMAAKNYFGHTLSDGTAWDQNIRNHGYGYSTALAENITAGSATASAAFNAFQGSATHTATMLSASYSAIGIGRAYNSKAKYGWYWTTTFGGVADGAAAICASGGGSTPAPTPTPTATPAPAPAASVYVAAVSGSKTTSRSSTTLTFTVTVKDTAGKLVGGAQVSMTVTAPNGSTQTVSGSTTTKGVATLTAKATAGSGAYVGTVTNVAASGKPYDPSKNVASSATVTV